MATGKFLIPTKAPNELVVSEKSVPDDTIIWRYFKFERFVDILEFHSLWFSRPFRFDDQWEGLFPPSYVRRTRQYADANGIPFDEFDREFRSPASTAPVFPFCELLAHKRSRVGRYVEALCFG